MKSQDKFYEDKSYKYFPGVAIIHFIQDKKIKKLLMQVVSEMKQSNLFDKYVFLPESSYHSTISDLLTYNDLNRNTSFKTFPLKEELDESIIDSYVRDLLKNSKFNINVNMNITKITARKVRLEPATEEDRLILNNFRMKIANLLNISFDINYKFHISLGYQLEHRTDEERLKISEFLLYLNKFYLKSFTTLNIGICDLVVFNNMSEFINIDKGRFSK
ncbi:DUF1868 domain-containing protein [Mycoplasmatota bacterium WC30]